MERKMVRNVNSLYTKDNHLARQPVHGYDHPDFIRGWEAARSGSYEYDNPYNAEIDHECFAQWREGWYDYTQAHRKWDRERKRV
jgi:hypothetical protein